MPIIGIAALNYSISGLVNMRIPSTYIDVIKRCGGTPIGIPVIDDDVYLDEIVGIIDGLLIPGGADINPILYNEEVGPYTKGIDDNLDIFQIKLIKKALDKDLPLLGICRGHQVLNVALGGTLYQDISDYNVDNKVVHDQLKIGLSYPDLVHEVTFFKDSKLEKIFGEKIMTNSFHHQIVKTLGDGLIAVGYSHDGVIEAMESTKHKFVVSVQYHPERSINQIPLIKLFIETANNNRR